MDSLDYIFRLMAVSQIAIWLTYCLYFYRTAQGYLLSAFLVSIGFYFVTPFTDIWGWGKLEIFAHLLGNLIPALLWILSRHFFSDKSNIPVAFIALTVGYLLLIMAPEHISATLIANAEYRTWIFYLLPQLVKMSLVVHVIYLSLATRSGDLIVERHRIRVPFAIIFAVAVTTVIAVEIGFESDVPGVISTLGSLVFFFMTLSATLFSLRLRPELAAITEVTAPLLPATSSPEPDVAGEENPVITQITQLMGEDRFYANYDVTLDVLAKKLNLPAYRLRPIINKQMGFKNFNQFLNSFRVLEACERLATERHLPILSIALDSGFKSLSVFNKAFKEAYGKTPSEFRQQL